MLLSRKIIYFTSVMLLAFLFHSCSLLKFKIESDATPLGSDLLKTRMHTHKFAHTFFHELMIASDSIMRNEANRELQINALVWKINASRQASNSIFQNDPEVAVLDTWLLTASMYDFLSDSLGENVFGDSQPIAVATSKILLAKIDSIAARAFKKKYDDAKIFIDNIKDTLPYQSLDFYRESVYDDWYHYQNIPDSLVEATIGTMPEVLSDFSSRMTIGTEQTLRQTQWSGQLLLKESNLDSLDIQAMSENFDKRFEELIVVLKNSGRNMQSDAIYLRKDLDRMSENMGIRVDSFFVFAKREMALMRDSLSVEREA
ncbi:MAG: hypothetical protein KAH25_07585, partial [Bacteroidales bacterium]|nr:hypothetical protein [Bacteroidales bacterium]